MQFVATLVPTFIPFPRFWTYVAAVALLSSGLGLLMPPVRRLAAMMTGWMVLSWVFLVHVPLIFTVGVREWMGVFEALGISGVCFLLADPPSPRSRRRPRRRAPSKSLPPSPGTEPNQTPLRPCIL